MTDEMSSKAGAAQTAERVLQGINAARAAARLNPLALSDELQRAAEQHCLAMAREGFFDHAGADGVEASQRAVKYGYRGQIGVSLSQGQTTPEEAVSDWLGEESFKVALLDPSYCHIGVAAQDMKWTLVLGAARPAAVSPRSSIEVAPDLLPAPSVQVPTEINAELRQAVMNLINHHRELAGAPLCSASAPLEQAAQLHSIDMVKRGFFAYETSDGHSLTQRAQEAGYPYRTVNAIFKGPENPDQLCETLFARQNQREHALDPDVRHLGVGMMRSSWTVIYGVPPAEYSPKLAQQMLQLVNAERLRAGVAPLQLDEKLNWAALSHSIDMARRDYYNFKHADGTGVADQVRRSGFSGRSFITVIAKGGNTAKEPLAQWMSSPGHRVHLLNPLYIQVGVGVAASCWTVVLGAE